MIYNPYLAKFGTTFGNFHSARDLGLYPTSKPVITAPEVQTSEIEIPGRDGKLDMTEALDGMPHYFNREGTWEFTSIGRENWTTAYHRLKNRLHGKKMRIVVDEENDGFYVGRLTVEEPEYDSIKGTAIFTVSGDLEPYKYSLISTLEDWPWNPFSWSRGIIRNYSHIQINTYTSEKKVNGLTLPAATIRKKSLTYENPTASDTKWQTYTNTNKLIIYGSDLPEIPNIILLYGNLDIRYIKDDGTKSGWYTLKSGDNGNKDYMQDFLVKDDFGTQLEFRGAGVIAIDIQLGWL